MRSQGGGGATHILMLEVLEQLQFSICSLRKYGSAERLHDFLHGHGLSSELVFCRTASLVSSQASPSCRLGLTRQGRRLPCRPAEVQHIYFSCQRIVHIPLLSMPAHLLVISKVVPKICARTNSAIVAVVQRLADNVAIVLA